jgi:hypothetical protein
MPSPGGGGGLLLWHRAAPELNTRHNSPTALIGLNNVLAPLGSRGARAAFGRN